MRTKSPKNPDQLRAMITREIEEIHAEIERLRSAAEARVGLSPAPREAGAVTVEPLRHNRHAFLME